MAVVSYARRRHSDVPVIVASVRPGNAQRLNAPASRSVFVAKPYDVDALVRTTRQRLGSRA